MTVTLLLSYLFMTGYGHTMFYLKKADFSFRRVAQILVRLNLLTVALAYAMDTDYLFYYFAPLVSFWYLVVYITLFLGHRHNEKRAFLLGKIALSAMVVVILHANPAPLDVLFGLLEVACNIHWDAPEWRFRVNLDVFIVYAGMLTAIAYGKSRELRITSHPKWTWIHRSTLTLSGVGLIWFFFFELTRRDKFEYNSWHPFVSAIPVVAFVLLRNATPVLRASSSWLYAFVGTCSLETFILQYHIWLAAGAIPTPEKIGSANKPHRYQRHSHHGTRCPLVDTTQLCCDFHCVYLD
jgi:N-acetylneuraminate 9-O-acetyltransferase